ncbi:tripartite motif-containing protein 65-like [Eriocheir sinensis]|uniref:tripartite motif-containing protein 65-like n=1 Tax=Eriocheir sinensis TaxID=95602 RepID=UPI0021C67DA8|nr:tripartite motif-containing protein 65-like [Eriocheir sinensis]XP_050703708.1 tripartite motif-containing protein 65-like [Eriocheir sinensis]XP_050703709.1 tripartite motif-containing protein 65-like [Eriocheir sinensis]XP_050703710.1 tripartite motif-containing protein 65-like [Eriocheir sinensis]XP_050703711.1 tripartite motif-containing protein 65-like [Eriocheir sinensis]XP_050703714.1 tripartite motif-containing protein 65-like [Eriocheir sinensis]XP_050703715.1 tripartite motif-con
MASAGKGPGDNPEECPVCLTGFDDLVQRPRTLPCGHTVCTLCIDKLKEQGRVTCPECRGSHAVPEGGQFPISYTIEAFVRRMRDVKASAAAASPPPSAGKGKGAAGSAGKMGAAGLSKKMRSLLQEQEATVVAAITACQEAQSQLDQYEATLTGWVERQQQLEDSLQGLMDQSRSSRELLQQEKFRVAPKRKEAKKKEQELQTVREKLRTRATEQEALKVLATVFHLTGEVEQVLEECQQCFPDAGILTTARKVREASSAALEAAKAVQAALETVSTEEPRPQSVPEEPRPQSDPEEPRPQSDPDLTIMEKVQFILKPSLKAEDFRSLTQRTRSLLQAGRVFAVHQVEGQRRHARISLEAGRPCLHALADHPPPLGASTLQVSQVVPPSPPCTVFLDLSWPGRAPRRVHIRLSPDTQRGRQFLMLCTGQRGPSYRGTRLYGVGDKGMPGECVWGGDYESNDGTGECVLLPGLEEGVEGRPWRAGAVWGDGRRGVFVITTRDDQGDLWPCCVFGEVVEGLHVVAEAAQHSDITEVTVVDCGVVL